MRLLPNIGPLDSSFPLFGAPRLRVVARGEGVPAAESDTVLTIEVTNLASRPTEVTSVHVGYMYMNGLSEAVFGTKAPELPLRELSGQASHPATLGPGESVVWTASLEQLAAEARERRLTLGPHSSWLEPNSLEPLERGVRFGQVGLAVRSYVSLWSHRRLAVVVRDEWGTIYKAKVRWRPPGGEPPYPRVSSLSRA